MPVAVTGASGLLGRAVVRRLASLGIETIAVARTAFTPPCGVRALRVSEYGAVPEAETVVHLAEERDMARAAVDSAGADARLERLLTGGGRIVYASSAAVYGDGADHPRRSDEPVSPPNAYAAGKLAREGRVLAAGGCVARLANLYGPGMAANSVLADILSQIPGRGALRVRDDRPVRDFVWVDDAAEAVVALVLRSGAGVFNVGTGTGVSVGALARLALDLAGEGHRPVEAEFPSERTSVLVLDPSATTAATGWVARTDLRSGLAHLIKCA